MATPRTRIMKCLICLVLLSLLCLTGCASESRRADELIARAGASEFGGRAGCPETVEVAAKAGVDYQRAVDRAMRRDQRSLHTLFWLTSNAGFDGASAEGNAAVLGNILRYVGDETFGAALSSEPESTRNDVRDMISYDFGEDVTEESLIEWYPRTLAPNGAR